MPHGIYECKTVPLSKLIITPKGPIKPLCDTCQSPDCEMPVSLKSVSMFGVVEKHKVYEGRHAEDRFVVQCNGYVSKDDEETIKILKED